MREKIEDQSPKIAKHIDLLKEYGFSNREIAQMISSFNGLKVSRKTVDRYLERNGNGRKSIVPNVPNPKSPMLPKRLKWACKDCGSSKLWRDRQNGEVVCETCGYVNVILRSNHVDLETQLESFTPESGLSANRGVGSWISPKDLQRMKLFHVSWQLQFGNDPTRLHAMIRYASKLLKDLPDLSSKTDEFKKARYAQIRWAADELIRLAYAQMQSEIQTSAVMTEDSLTIRGKQLAHAVIDICLCDFLGEKHRILQTFRSQNEVNQELRGKLLAMLSSQYPKVWQPQTPSRALDNQETNVMEIEN
jgi:hypothetical protein